MKPVICYSLLLFVLISCSKDSTFQTESETAPDNILYKQYEPAVELSSVDSFNYVITPMGNYNAPIPSDSTITYSIDLDGDGTDDYRIMMKHYYHLLSMSSPGVNYNYRIELSGADANRLVSASQSTPVALFYSDGQKINKISDFIQSSILYLYEPANLAPVSISFSGEKYIGLRMKTATGYHYGWLRLSLSDFKLSIVDQAINLTAVNSIRAGQKE